MSNAQKAMLAVGIGLAGWFAATGNITPLRISAGLGAAGGALTLANSL